MKVEEEEALCSSTCIQDKEKEKKTKDGERHQERNEALANAVKGEINKKEDITRMKLKEQLVENGCLQLSCLDEKCNSVCSDSLSHDVNSNFTFDLKQHDHLNERDEVMKHHREEDTERSPNRSKKQKTHHDKNLHNRKEQHNKKNGDSRTKKDKHPKSEKALVKTEELSDHSKHPNAMKREDNGTDVLPLKEHRLNNRSSEKNSKKHKSDNDRTHSSRDQHKSLKASNSEDKKKTENLKSTSDSRLKEEDNLKEEPDDTEAMDTTEYDEKRSMERIAMGEHGEKVKKEDETTEIDKEFKKEKSEKRSKKDKKESRHLDKAKDVHHRDKELNKNSNERKKQHKSKSHQSESGSTNEREEAHSRKRKHTGDTSTRKKIIKNEKDNKHTVLKEDEEKNKQGDDKWKWWEEVKSLDGTKWKFLEHKGPVFAPAYEPLPDSVHFYYNGNPMKLAPETEEVATFYAKMLDHEYTTKEMFQKNFFHDWRKELKAEQEKVQKEFGYCVLDGHKEKIGNFKIEPPGLFRGRGDHPKMGMLKRRIVPEDVIINCSKDSGIPKPPPGHKWKEVRHDNTVTWLASWTENIQGAIKYIMLNPSSKLKGEKDWQKFETARKLKDVVDSIRLQYRRDWKSHEMKKRQRGVALYFIDKLALRAGNEKEEGETADTVGCCSLRVEHIKLHEKIDGQEYVVEFDFLGKDSIRYYNKVPVEKAVFKNLHRFMENKNPEDDLFDRLNTDVVNKYLRELMDGLTAKVFRTYNASITLQQQLKELTDSDSTVAEKILSYNRANRAVAILCNHQRAAPKTFEKSMQNLQTKIEQKELQIKEAKQDLKRAKADHKVKKDEKSKKTVEKKEAVVKRLEEQLKKLLLQATDREENKQIALGTSKLNYLDPRISVAWCKKYGVPIEKIYNKTQREKFAWAIDMTNEDFEF
ncbi:DNA topoisomerase I, mitochondrial-like isoform X2 [Polypterus senegalus]|uniref:DNA topoisomerase I, mitochondrial-like isoform X2 n=1 Tax=Polypterus senegalus TaxID=55291 RepID=UPI00196294E2|nr:DNA topoisomerase I, mitochondrial-like isoform X2 [Polypterus senegalus]